MSLYPVVIVWEQPDGALQFTTTGRRPHPGESEGQFLDRIALDAISAGVVQPEWRRGNVLLARMPNAKRWFRPPGVAEDAAAAGAGEVQVRNCLRLAGGRVVVAQAPLRAEYMRCLRRERNRRLAASDGDRARVEEIGTADEQHALRIKRQALRDLPATVAADLDRLTTPEELEAYLPPWPE